MLTTEIFLSGCGTGANDVASVAGVSISKASLDHWTRVEAVLSYRLYPTKPVPMGVLPDPPSYRACILWLGSASGSVEDGTLSASRRKIDCQRRLESLKRKTLGFLISYQWYAGELRAQGIDVPESDVQGNIRRLYTLEIPGRRNFEHYLAATGMSEADVVLIQRDIIYSEKIGKEIQAKSNASAMEKALVEFTSKWIAKTDCRPEYVVAGCKQYRGKEPPP